MNEEAGKSGLPLKKERSSIWWYVVHIWCAACIDAYAKMMGYAEGSVIGHLMRGSDAPISANAFALETTLFYIASLAVGFFVSRALFRLIDKFFVRKSIKLISKLILPILYLLVMVSLVAINRDNKSLLSLVYAPITATTVHQDAGILKQGDFDEDMLTYFQDWVVTELKERIGGEYSIKTRSSYEQVGSVKLAVIRSVIGSEKAITTIFGLKDDTLIRVMCYREGQTEIPIRSGVCSKKLFDNFGFALIDMSPDCIKKRNTKYWTEYCEKEKGLEIFEEIPVPIRFNN